MPKDLFKISEVASFFGITTTTLRYYESAGLLTPVYVDKDTQYRYYDINDINTVAYILDIRKSGMNISDTKKYLKGGLMLQNYIEQLRRMREIIDNQIKIFEYKNTAANIYNIEETELNETNYIKIEQFAPTLEDMYPQMFDFLSSSVKVATIDVSPVSFIRFDNVVPVFKDIEYTLGLEVLTAKEPIFHRNACPALHTFHKGCYENIDKGYAAIVDFAEKHKIKLKGYTIEKYYESFNFRRSPESFLTEIIMPIEDK